MAQTTSPKVSEIIQEMSNIFAIPLSQADRLVHSALNNGQFVIALPFSPDSSLLQVEAGSGFPSESSGQVQTQFVTGKAGQAVTAGTGITHTITAGKKFYCTSIIVCDDAANIFEIRDGGSSGTKMQTAYVAAERAVVSTYSPPIIFSTNVWVDVNTTGTVYYAIVGYEQ